MENQERRRAIGKNLQQLRKQAGYKSANAFAEKLGINPGTYTGYEQGRGAFSYERAWDMADALGVTLDELGGREWPPGGAPALSPDERSLVDSYRRATDDDRATVTAMANLAAIAGDAKKESDGRHVDMAEHSVTSSTR